MAQLQQLRADHAPAVLAFEVANRAYFARSISDRGDDFFENFAARFDALLDDQWDGCGAYYVLVDDDVVVGRFNLRLAGVTATLGYRVAEAAAGRGLATAAVRTLCELAGQEHKVRRIAASTSEQNAASQAVLRKAGFTHVGAADPADVGGKPGYRYERRLP